MLDYLNAGELPVLNLLIGTENRFPGTVFLKLFKNHKDFLSVKLIIAQRQHPLYFL